MKIQAIDSQVWWIALADEIRPLEGLDGPTFFGEISKALEFKDPPKPGPNNAGVEFSGGFLRDAGKAVPITKIAIYNDGINVVVQGSTSVTEEILQRVLRIGASLGVRSPTTPPVHHYLSTIVVDFEKSMDSIVPKPFLDKISAASFRKDSHFLSIAFSADKTELKGPFSGVNPTSFSIGRRIDVPYHMNRYFSQASTTTEAHIELLESLESSLK